MSSNRNGRDKSQPRTMRPAGTSVVMIWIRGNEGPTRFLALQTSADKLAEDFATLEDFEMLRVDTIRTDDGFVTSFSLKRADVMGIAVDHSTGIVSGKPSLVMP